MSVTIIPPHARWFAATFRIAVTDVAGNAEAVQSQLIQIDNNAPTSTISCNGGTCSAGWYSATVQVGLSAADTGGSGVGATYYTTDGSTPTTSSTRYTGAFNVASTAAERFFGNKPRDLFGWLVRRDGPGQTVRN